MCWETGWEKPVAFVMSPHLHPTKGLETQSALLTSTIMPPTNLPKKAFFLRKDYWWVLFTVWEGAGWDGGYERNQPSLWIKGESPGLVLTETGWSMLSWTLAPLSKPTGFWAHTQQPPMTLTRLRNAACISTWPSLLGQCLVAESLCISSKRTVCSLASSEGWESNN